jgi:cysteine desulfurase
MAYLDNASTKKTNLKILKSYKTYLDADFANPSSTHRAGREATKALYSARSKVAKVLNCDMNQIVFTSSCTEANNLAIIGCFLKHYESQRKQQCEQHYESQSESQLANVMETELQSADTKMLVHKKPSPISELTKIETSPKDVKRQRNTILIGATEHPSVIEPAKMLSRLFSVHLEYVPVDEKGVTNLRELERLLSTNSVLLTSIMLVNNETGTISPVYQVAKLTGKYGSLLLVDSAQAPSPLLRSVAETADFMTLSSHKIGGPHGVGALFVRNTNQISPIIYGGGQELGLRSGTENVASILAFADTLALEAKLEPSEIDTDSKRSLIKLLKPLLISKKVLINGFPLDDTTHRVSYIVNLSVMGFDAEFLMYKLDELDIQLSVGSACNAGVAQDSHVLKAMNLPKERRSSAIRISFSNTTKETDVRYFIKCINSLVSG